MPMDQPAPKMSSGAPDMAQVEVIAPNFKWRLSGVTSTIIQLAPLQARMIGIATLGPGLPDTLPRMAWWQLPALWKRPASGRKRIWHARRNIETITGILLKHVLRVPLHLVFTSASQRQHTAWTKMLIRCMDAVVATSRMTASYLEVPNMVVMHGIDTDRFRPPVDRAAAARSLSLPDYAHFVGCFGRLRHQKGTDLFVDAMISLLPAYPGWCAIVAGRTTPQHAIFEEGLRQRVTVAGLSHRILFVGEHSDIENWYRALSLFVAPQRWEGFGLTPLEAMATGVPVVATKVGAFAELIVDGKTGRLAPRDDLGALTKAIERYLEDPQRIAQHGQNAIEHVRENFPLQREADELSVVYNSLWARERR